MKRLLLSLFLLAGMATPSMAADLSIVSLTSTTAGAISTTGSVVVSQTGVGVRNLPIPELNVLLNISATSTKTINILSSSGVISVTGLFTTVTGTNMQTTTLTVSGVSTLGGAMQLNNNLSVTGTANIFGATTLSGPVTMSSTLGVTGLLSGATGNFTTSLSSALITPTTLNVLGNSTFTGTSALLGFVGIAGQPTTTAAMFVNSRSVSGTNGYGLFVAPTTGATNNYGACVSGVLLVGQVQTSQSAGITTTGPYNTTLEYRHSGQAVIGQASNVVQLGNNSGWVGSAMFAGSTEMLRATNTNIVTGTTTGNASARLQVDSTTQGFLMPRMTTTQRDAIATPATGLMLWNTTTATVNFYNGSAWVP